MYLRGMSSYRLMLYFLAAFLVSSAVVARAGVLPYPASVLVLQALLLPAACWVFNAAAARWARVPSNPESSLITGLILAATAGPLLLPHAWLPLLVLVGSAVASKYLLVIRRSHVFNPAAAGMFVSAAALGMPVSWWTGSPELASLTAAGGLAVLWKTRRLGMAVSFLLSYLGLLGLELLF